MNSGTFPESAQPPHLLLLDARLLLDPGNDFTHVRLKHHAAHHQFIEDVVDLRWQWRWSGAGRQAGGCSVCTDAAAAAHEALEADLVNMENQIQFANILEALVQRFDKHLPDKARLSGQRLAPGLAHLNQVQDA